MKRSTTPTDLLLPGGSRRAARRLRLVGLAALLLTASATSLGSDGQRWPGSVPEAVGGDATGMSSPADAREPADGGTPPTAAPPPDSGRINLAAPGERGTVVPGPWSGNGIPASVLTAYRHATAVLSRTLPGCHLQVALLAAIGKVESGHAHGGRVDRDGRTLRPILGPVLDGGTGIAVIRDTDDGRFDGDPVWDRAVGPMQFIPSTWQRWAADGNGDGVADPHNVFDAAVASGRYLCAGGRDLATPDDLQAAVYSYNHSTAYVQLVLSWLRVYADGTSVVPDGTGQLTGDAGTDWAAGGSGDGAEDSNSNDGGPTVVQAAQASAGHDTPGPPAQSAPNTGEPAESDQSTGQQPPTEQQPAAEQRPPGGQKPPAGQRPPAGDPTGDPTDDPTDEPAGAAEDDAVHEPGSVDAADPTEAVDPDSGAPCAAQDVLDVSAGLAELDALAELDGLVEFDALAELDRLADRGELADLEELAELAGLTGIEDLAEVEALLDNLADGLPGLPTADQTGCSETRPANR